MVTGGGRGGSCILGRKSQFGDKTKYWSRVVAMGETMWTHRLPQNHRLGSDWNIKSMLQRFDPNENIITTAIIIIIARDTTENCFQMVKPFVLASL